MHMHFNQHERSGGLLWIATMSKMAFDYPPNTLIGHVLDIFRCLHAWMQPPLRVLGPPPWNDGGMCRVDNSLWILDRLIQAQSDWSC